VGYVKEGIEWGTTSILMRNLTFNSTEAKLKIASYTSDLSESSTKCGSEFFRGKVWIKVYKLPGKG
jgi:hypothetical protein